MGEVGASAYLSLIERRRGGRLFEAVRLLTFSAFRMGAYSKWALIRGWAPIRYFDLLMSERLANGFYKLPFNTPKLQRQTPSPQNVCVEDHV